MASQTVGLRLDAETQERLKKLGKARDRSPHYLMKQAVEQFLTYEEEIAAEDKLLNERWEEFMRHGKSYSQDEVEIWIADKIKASKTK